MQSQRVSAAGHGERRRAPGHTPTTEMGATLVEVTVGKEDARKRLGDGEEHARRSTRPGRGGAHRRRPWPRAPLGPAVAMGIRARPHHTRVEQWPVPRSQRARGGALGRAALVRGERRVALPATSVVPGCGDCGFARSRPYPRAESSKAH
jgi:hypothetical protein